MKKKIIEYILRVFLFITLSGLLHEVIGIPIMEGVESFFGFFYEKKPIFNFDVNIELFFGLIIGLFSLFIAYIGVTYFFAKICGIFKKLDNLKKWQAFLIIILINVVIFLLDEFLDKHRSIPYLIRGSITETDLFFVPSYLFYLFLNFLTKKFPKPFKKIGYYCSIEFFKKIFHKNTI